jgi:hypothetical protein
MAAEFKVASAYADFRIDVDEGIDKAKARIKQRQRDLDASAKIKLDVDLQDAKRSIRNEFKDERFTVKADADTTLARARLEKLTGEGTFKIKPDVDASAARRAEQAMDGTVSRMANRANSKFDLLKFTVFTAGLPTAAAAGSAATVAAFGIVPVAFAGMAVAMLRDTDAVASKWGAFSGMVVNDAQTMSMSLQDEVVGAVDDMGAAWVRLRPKVESAMLASAPAIRDVTGAVTDLAEEAMPGLIIAAQHSGDAIKGLRTFAGQTGAGLNDMFVNLSNGSESSGKNMVILGGTVQTLLGRIGQLAANLANAGEGPLRSFDVIVDQLSGSLVDVTAKGSGTVGMLQGFSTSGSGLVTVLHGVLAAAAALPPGITEVGGSILATSMIASKFGIDATAGFDGFTKKVSEAKGASGKFTAAWTGVAGGLLNPATLAVTALGLGLNLLGEYQERAAAHAAEHRDNVRSLTQAIREDNGVMGEHVSKVNMTALETKNAASNLATFGRNLGDAKLAIDGNSDAYDRLNYSARAQLETIGKNAGFDEEMRGALKSLGTEALNTGKSYDQLSDAGGRGARVAGMLQGVWSDQVNAIINGNAAVGEQVNSQKLAMEAYYQSESALTGLSEAQVKARDATIAHTQANLDAVGGELGYRGAVQATKQAMADYTKTNQDHKASEDQKSQALLGAEQAMYRQVQAAGQAAAATYRGTNENERASMAAAAMNRETVNLANTWQGQLPASLQTGISKMSVGEARAAGLTVAIDGTGNAVYRLPNGKEIRIESNADQQKARVDALRESIDALHNRDVKITTTYFYGTAGGGGGGYNGPAVARAQGGLVGRLAAASGRAYAGGVDAVAPINGGLMGSLGRSIRDTIPALIAQGEAVTNAQDTAKNYNELRAINNGQRNYEKYPATGRPPERHPDIPAQRGGAPTVNLGGVTVIGADPDEVLTKMSNRLRWAVR